MIEPLLRPSRRVPSTVLHVMGLGLAFVSIGMAVSAMVEWADGGEDGWPLLMSAILLGSVGVVVWQGTRIGRVTTSTVFAAVAWTWVVVSVAGALPYLLAGTFQTWDDAVFEAVSGFSCTGSTVFGGPNGPIGAQGKGLLLYRQLSQWYGGMGIVVLAVAVLPFLGVGGLDLIQAEAPGPTSSRLAPRVRETAKRYWILYAGLTTLIALVLFVTPGMGLYDSVAHAFTAAATGGFSTRDQSIGYFDSAAVEAVVIGAMFLGGTNFVLHWRAVTGRPDAYRRDAEFRGYVVVVIGAVGLVSALLWLLEDLSFGTSLRMGAFNTVSLGTSTGFGNATGATSPGDYVAWAASPQVVLLFVMVFGAMTGSTSGGMKILRLQVGAKHAIRALRQARHPRAVLPLTLGDQAVSESIVNRMAGFGALYAVIAVSGVLVVTALGTDVMTAVGGVVGSLGNMGPALNEVGPTDSFLDGFSRPARMVLAWLMLVGRLEIFPMMLMVVAPARSVAGRLPHRHTY